MSILDWFKPVQPQAIVVAPTRPLQAKRLRERIRRLEQAVLDGDNSGAVILELARLKEQE